MADTLERKRRDRGQIIVIAPILILLMVASILLAINISRVARERIKIQVSGDAAAHAGALVQAKALSAISIMNDMILGADALIALGLAEIAEGLALIATIVGIPEGLKLLASGIKKVQRGRKIGNGLRKTQKVIMTGTPVAAEAAVVATAAANGYPGSIVPGLSHVRLDLKDSWFIPDPPFIKFRMRGRSEIREKIVAFLFKARGGNVFGNDLLRGLGGGRDLRYPALISLSAARPYYHLGGHNPRNKEVDRLVSMIALGKGWNAKLERIW